MCVGCRKTPSCRFSYRPRIRPRPTHLGARDHACGNCRRNLPMLGTLHGASWGPGEKKFKQTQKKFDSAKKRLDSGKKKSKRKPKENQLRQRGWRLRQKEIPNKFVFCFPAPPEKITRGFVGFFFGFLFAGTPNLFGGAEFLLVFFCFFFGFFFASSPGRRGVVQEPPPTSSGRPRRKPPDHKATERGRALGESDPPDAANPPGAHTVSGYPGEQP